MTKSNSPVAREIAQHQQTIDDGHLRSGQHSQQGDNHGHLKTVDQVLNRQNTDDSTMTGDAGSYQTPD